jgi:hypothetical protein
MVTANSRVRALDRLVQQARHARGLEDHLVVVGFVLVELYDEDGQLKHWQIQENLITTVGDEYYAKKGSAVAIDTVTGMKLGTGTTAVSKSGAGSAIVTYNTGETASKAIDATFPTAASKGGDTGWRITWKTTWNAGESTRNSLAEVVISNQNPLADTAGTAANTISRALLSPVVNKGANDTLAITWQHDFLGA